MNRKKLALIGTGVTVGTFLLITSAYAGIAETSGYDTYKSAIKNTVTAKSMTDTVAVSIQDNGKQVVSVNAIVKKDKPANAVSANVNIQGGGSDQSVNVYTTADGKKVIKTGASEVYNVFDAKDTQHGREMKKEKADVGQGDKFNQEAENLIDALVGNLKQYVNETAAVDGSKEIHVSLSGSQLPTAVNAVGSFLVKKASHDSLKAHESDTSNKKELFGADLSSLKQAMPKLTQDVAITNVDIQASVDANNTITKQKATLAISGKDESGAAHMVTVNVDLGISGLNTTTPDSIDLTGKQVQTVDAKQWDKSKFNH
ncbi:hypothetical protein GC093_28070 [Paenibacillus sp. LMG 31456]|uniref:Uncharacterized protein n=1 Tax=Paenibacillus foliorum TaxID=2654974 RepID=A0A972H655_9BACL|nr:hypothetical protein [Paenibacillus foliorum]NOU97051.1 hypothetical protein [Paenibacillus foliorum]